MTNEEIMLQLKKLEFENYLYFRAIITLQLQGNDQQIEKLTDTILDRAKAMVEEWREENLGKEVQTEIQI